MRAPSEPAINKNNPKEWFIYWNQDVPQPLWKYYPRKRIRIKINDDINRFKGQEREDFAEERRVVWKYNVVHRLYDPFEDQLAELAELEKRKEVIAEVVTVEAAEPILTPEQARKLTPLRKALDLWIDVCKERTKNKNSISTYRVTATWLLNKFEANGLGDIPVNEVTRLQLSEALMARKKEKNWEATTYNNEYDTLINIFNWLRSEEYIDNNPIAGTIKKIRTKKHKHIWFDKVVKKAVKEELIKRKEMLVYHVMEFTYWLMIRSKTELMKLKAADIDRTLKRIRFSAELSKNNSEAYRDYDDEFELVLDAINFDAIPKNFYIFGKKGEPSEYKCHKDLFADRWRPVREELGLSDDYTIYGMKHTRIVHELMKKTDGYDISYKARHKDPKSTKDYMRDYDITLKNVYGPEDLTF